MVWRAWVGSVTGLRVGSAGMLAAIAALFAGGCAERPEIVRYWPATGAVDAARDGLFILEWSHGLVEATIDEAVLINRTTGERRPLASGTISIWTAAYIPEKLAEDSEYCVQLRGSADYLWIYNNGTEEIRELDFDERGWCFTTGHGPWASGDQLPTGEAMPDAPFTPMAHKSWRSDALPLEFVISEAYSPAEVAAIERAGLAWTAGLHGWFDFFRFEQGETPKYDTIGEHFDHLNGVYLLDGALAEEFSHALGIAYTTAAVFNPDTDEERMVIIEGDVFINRPLHSVILFEEFDGTDYAYNLSNVMHHELGHILGLDHEPNYPAIMSAGERPYEPDRQPTVHDFAKLAATYFGPDTGAVRRSASTAAAGDPPELAGELSGALMIEETYTLYVVDGEVRCVQERSELPLAVAALPEPGSRPSPSRARGPL